MNSVLGSTRFIERFRNYYTLPEPQWAIYEVLKKKPMTMQELSEILGYADRHNKPATSRSSALYRHMACLRESGLIHSVRRQGKQKIWEIVD